VYTPSTCETSTKRVIAKRNVNTPRMIGKSKVGCAPDGGGSLSAARVTDLRFRSKCGGYTRSWSSSRFDVYPHARHERNVAAAPLVHEIEPPRADPLRVVVPLVGIVRVPPETVA
jgi:hypothetical protein